MAGSAASCHWTCLLLLHVQVSSSDAQYIESIDEKIKVYVEVDELLQQAVTEERFEDAARLRKQVAACQPR